MRHMVCAAVLVCVVGVWVGVARADGTVPPPCPDGAAACFARGAKRNLTLARLLEEHGRSEEAEKHYENATRAHDKQMAKLDEALKTQKASKKKKPIVAKTPKPASTAQPPAICPAEKAK